MMNPTDELMNWKFSLLLDKAENIKICLGVFHDFLWKF